MIVGIIGGGQLARMLALAGHPLGVRCLFLDPAPDACARSVGELILGDYDDSALLDQIAQRAQVVTYEFENVPADSLQYLAARTTVHPTASALQVARDRWHEKQLFVELGIPTPRFMAVDSPGDLETAVATIGLPAVLKTRTLGYDGKGQRVLRTVADLADALATWGGSPLILEGFVPFSRELSVIAVRGLTGDTKFYPLNENIHKDGVLAQSVSRPGDPMTARAEDYARRLLDRLGYVGVLALELFQEGDTLFANEMAPRVHNSGHWTIEGAETSQFENHMRAILGLPLGSTDPLWSAGMVNFIGRLPDTAQVLGVPGAHMHVYGKEARPGRKLGHATVRAHDEGALRQALAQLQVLARP
ncbi:MAG TPA: 5-(carboxyamino)imidazole ribonucleotide synthase [Acidiferrobacter sp.]|nr:5-(carboxyamino)imidazole ribonucleotide synthase [Acidiferrobacter sp.]